MEFKVKYKLNETRIVINNGLITILDSYLNKDCKYFVLIDKKVYSLYEEYFRNPKFIIKEIEAIEENKNLKTVNDILKTMILENITKSDYLVNVGGGIISDIGGYIASIYKRGINYYNIPTTLIGQVDASIGGKTGVDFSLDNINFKNQIGTIYQPDFVLIDPLFLKTLPKSKYLEGFSEIIKYGLCFNKDLFYSLFSSFKIEDLVKKSAKIKSEITAYDEFDYSIRKALNYGHTIAHAIEALSNFQIPHGIAVAYGLVYETKDEFIKSEISKLLLHLGFNLDLAFPKAELIKYIREDKKITNNEISVPILKGIGEVEIITKNIDDYLGEILWVFLENH